MVKIRTKYDEKVWIHEKYLKLLFVTGTPLQVFHKGKIMTITKEDIQKNKPVRSNQSFEERYGGGEYWLYGFTWIPDSELTLFS